MLLDRVAKLVVVMPRQHTPVGSYGVITLTPAGHEPWIAGFTFGNSTASPGRYPAAANRAQPPNEHSRRAQADQTDPDTQHSRNV